MRNILTLIVVQLALLLVIADVAQSDQHTGEARCYHSPEKVRLYSISNDIAFIMPMEGLKIRGFILIYIMQATV